MLGIKCFLGIFGPLSKLGRKKKWVSAENAVHRELLRSFFFTSCVFFFFFQESLAAFAIIKWRLNGSRIHTPTKQGSDWSLASCKNVKCFKLQLQKPTLYLVENHPNSEPELGA